jgi:hypothetical protein
MDGNDMTSAPMHRCTLSAIVCGNTVNLQNSFVIMDEAVM